MAKLTVYHYYPLPVMGLYMFPPNCPVPLGDLGHHHHIITTAFNCQLSKLQYITSVAMAKLTVIIIMYYRKKLNSLKHFVRTTVAESHK